MLVPTLYCSSPHLVTFHYRVKVRAGTSAFTELLLIAENRARSRIALRLRGAVAWTGIFQGSEVLCELIGSMQAREVQITQEWVLSFWFLITWFMHSVLAGPVCTACECTEGGQLAVEAQQIKGPWRGDQGAFRDTCSLLQARLGLHPLLGAEFR